MPRPDVSSERNEQILLAAAVVFARLGFQAARMEDIAREAGLSKGSLYLYFSSKDAIIAGLRTVFFGRQLDDARAVLEAPGSAGEIILRLTDRLADDVERMAEVLPIAWEFYALAARHEDTRLFFRDYFRSYRDLLATFFRDRLPPSDLRAADPDQLAIALLGLYEGITLLWLTDPERVSWKEQTQSAARRMMGIPAPRPREASNHGKRRR